MPGMPGEAGTIGPKVTTCLRNYPMFRVIMVRPAPQEWSAWAPGGRRGPGSRPPSEGRGGCRGFGARKGTRASQVLRGAEGSRVPHLN